MRNDFKLVLVFLASIGVAPWACSPDSTEPSLTLTAPTTIDPVAGSEVSNPQPTLRVGNATGPIGLRYRFEVATDSDFSNMVALGGDIPEGGGGTTSWQINTPLSIDTFYHWRARAFAENIEGPFSQPASFEVVGGFITSTPENLIYVSDPLLSGTSVGEVGGGVFRKEGWMATDALSYIRYVIPTTPNGYVEFDVTNLRNPNPHSDKRNLMIMWDPSKGEYTTNPFRVHLAKYDTQTVDRWHMRLRFISNGQETNTGIDFFDWDPSRVYHFRMEWGAFPEIVSNQRVQVLMDGVEILSSNYDPIYRPNPHWVELGMAPRAESLEQAIYSNVMIGIRQP